jgi:hypothetical protein
MLKNEHADEFDAAITGCHGGSFSWFNSVFPGKYQCYYLIIIITYITVTSRGGS